MENKSVETISAKKLQEKKELNPELIIINVLDQDTFNDCHIANSKNIPLDNLVHITSSWSKDKEVIVYCASATCPKSETAYHTLKDMGFSKVLRYVGGTKEWFNDGYETAGPCTLKYLK